MKRHIITVVFFVAAIAFYAIGAAIPGTTFLLIGGLAELVFWFRLMKSGKADSIR